MLVLSRKRNEWLTIGDSVGVRLRTITRGRHGPMVQIWLKGPEEIDFKRNELFDRLSDSERKAVTKSLYEFQQIDRSNPIDWKQLEFSESLSGILELDRCRDEAVYIAGGLATITIVEIREDKVRFGLDAPRAIPLHRLEVYKEIQRERV